MSLSNVDLGRLRQVFDPNISSVRRSESLNRAFTWVSLDPESRYFSGIYRRLRRGTETAADTRVLMGLYAYATAAQNRLDGFARSCALMCCTWTETSGGHLLRRIFHDGTAFSVVDFEVSLPGLLQDLSQYDRPISLGWSQRIQQEFGEGAQTPTPTPTPTPASLPEISVTDLPFCCAAQYISKWGCGDPDGYNPDMGVEEVGKLFDSGFFDRLKPVQITVLQKYQLEEGLDDLLKSKGWVCLADEVRNNKGVPTLSIWAYFNHNEECDDDDDDYLDEEY